MTAPKVPDDRILDRAASLGPVTIGVLAADLGMRANTLSDRVDRLVKRGDLARDKQGRVRLGTGKPQQPRRLPVVQGHLVPGEGERLDCARYEDCLDAFCAAHPRNDPPAHCPPACRFHLPPPKDSAVRYASSGRDHYEAAIYAEWGPR